MSIADADLARLLVAMGLLLGGATVLGHLFAKARQPPVIGEILAGILLGPTLLGAVWPGAEHWIFGDASPVPVILAALYQLGLLLLMFISGSQMRGIVDRTSARTIGIVTSIGLLVPLLAGLALVGAIGATQFEGAARSRGALVLVFGIGVAVTSIPVISRIMHDLGLLRTRFARIVLSVAVLEDVVVYVVLAVAIGMAGGSSSTFGLAPALGLTGVAANSAYHTLVALAFLAVGLTGAPRLSRYLLRHRLNVIGRRSPIAFQLLWMFAFSLAALLLGIVPIFGAFIAGIATYGDRDKVARDARDAISSFGFSFLIPIYFAVVGVKLDLLHDFDIVFFVGFLAFACAVKAASVFAAARIAGERARMALHFAVAVNARGGPGIVLASVSYDAGIVDRSFFATLVMLSVVTSLLAGWWLERVKTELVADDPGVPTQSGASDRIASPWQPLIPAPSNRFPSSPSSTTGS
jgi:Kef-type K+ transport system membrane component KefB